MPVHTTDDVLLEAIRQRMKRQIERDEEKAAAHVINNYVGGNSGGSGGSGGVMSQLGGENAKEGDDPFEYIVDITKTDKPDGWEKHVTRYRKPKGEEPKKKRA